MKNIYRRRRISIPNLHLYKLRMTVPHVLRGTIVTILSTDVSAGTEIGRKLGKLHEDEATKIFYRKKDEYLTSILFPTGLPNRLLEVTECLTTSSGFYLNVPVLPKSEDGEILLLAEASGLSGQVLLSSQDGEKLLKGTSLIKYVSKEVSDPSVETSDLGYVSVDKMFQVRGVGTVILGFSNTELMVHDKLTALPNGKEVEIKSIQVLDEDQERVGPGVRVGIAVKNLRPEDLKGIYSLVKAEVKTMEKVKGRLTKFEWSEYSPGTYHVIAAGSSSVALIEGQGEVEVKLNRKLPSATRLLVLNLNAKPKKPRVIGYIEV